MCFMELLLTGGPTADGARCTRAPRLRSAPLRAKYPHMFFLQKAEAEACVPGCAAAFGRVCESE